MEIRPAESEDVASIQAVVEAAYSRYLPRIGRAPAPMTADYEALVAAGETWVGIAEGRVVGVLVLKPAEDSLELENIAVEPSAQGHGLGRELMAFVEKHAQDLGLPAVTLYTNEAMHENLRLYPHLGFVETERREEKGYRRVFFRKSLDVGASPS